MAADELLSGQIGRLAKYLEDTRRRWRDAANAARANPNYSIDDLFHEARAQFVDNWDTWTDLVLFPGAPEGPMPTISLRRAIGTPPIPSAAAPHTSSTYVAGRLSDASFDKTALEPFGAGAAIPVGSYDLSFSGDFDGRLVLELKAEPPAAGVYRGLALADLSGGSSPEPLAWLVVVAT